MKKTVKLLSLILALVFVVALFAGCGGQQEETPDPVADPDPAPTEMIPEISKSDDHEVTEETKYADEIIAGFADVGSIFTPLTANSAGQVSQIAYLMMYNTLLARDPDNLDGYIPELATEWSANEDYTQWTFKLRDDVYFHNGEKLTAEDVRFTWEAFMAVPGSTGALKLGDVTDVEIVNDYEVIYHLAKTNVDFENYAANHGTLIMCKKAVEADPENGPLIGSGVWKFESFQGSDHLTLVANENTWEKPALAKKFTFKSVAEQTAKAIMLENGEIDFCSDVAFQNLAKYEADPNLALDKFSNISTNYIAFNMNSPIASDINFRRACAYAVDREAINAIATQGVGAAWTSQTYWGRGTAYGRDDLPALPQDLEKAKEYLAQSSYVEGTEVLLLTASAGIHADVAQVVQQQLAEIGITIEIFGTDTATMMANSAWGSTSYDMMVFGGPWESIPGSCYFTIQTGLIGNKAQFSNARVDELITLGASTPNGPERQAIFEEIQQIVADEIPYIGTLNQNVAYGRQANCGGGVYWPEGVIEYTYVYKILEE